MTHWDKYVAYSQELTVVAPVRRRVGNPVIGHHPLDLDADTSEPGDHPFKEGRRRSSRFVGMDFGVSNACTVIDGDVQAFMTRTTPALMRIVVKPQCSEIFHVHVDKRTRRRHLVAHNRQPALWKQSADTAALEYFVDR